MTLSAPLLRLRQTFSALLGGRSARYSGSDVRALLDPNAAESGERRRAVLSTAAVPGSWISYLRDRDVRELGRLAERLPTIVCLHASGVSLDELARPAGTRSTWRVEQALNAAADCIAARLNDERLPAVRGAG